MLERFFNLSPDLLAISKFSGHFTRLNLAWEKILGYTEAELIDRPCYDWIHPDDVEITQSEMKKLASGIPSTEFENRYRCQDGTYKRLAWTIFSCAEEGLVYGIAREVTDCRRLEAARQESDMKVGERPQGEVELPNSETNHLLLNAIPNLLIRMDRDGTYLDFIPAKDFKNVMLYQNMLGRTIFEAMPLEVAQQRMHYVELALQTGNTQVYEYEFELDGELYSEEAQIAVSGKDEVLVIVRDISDRKQIEVERDQAEVMLQQRELALQQLTQDLDQRVQQRTIELQQANDQLQAEIQERQRVESALRQSEERFRQVFQGAPIGMALADAQTQQIIQANSVFCQLLGYSASEIATLKITDVTYPEDSSLTTQHLDSSQGVTENCRLEKRYIKKNGNFLWVSVTATVLRDSDGKPCYRLAMIEDISDRKAMQDALRQSEEQLHLVLQNMPVMLDAFDENGNIIVWNQECERVTGYSADEIVNNPGAIEILYPDSTYLQQALAIWNQPGYDYRNDEWDITCKDGSVKTIAWSSISKSLSIPGWKSWGVGVDVSDRKQAEAKILKALQQERKLNELKSQFITMVSHEFRTPLSTILSATELLQKYGHQSTEERQQQRYQRIINAVDRMTELLNHVLLVGQAEAGELPFNPTPVELDSFCRELLEELQLNVKEKYSLRFTYEGETGLFYLDAQLLHHILINLLSNAIKYSPEGGEVHLKVMSRDGEAVFQVQDRGIGISEEDREQLFTLFKRGSNVGTISGTGLGLAIVKQCVDRHQGSILIESQLTVGTLVTVKIPSQLLAGI